MAIFDQTLRVQVIILLDYNNSCILSHSRHLLVLKVLNLVGVVAVASVVGDVGTVPVIHTSFHASNIFLLFCEYACKCIFFIIWR